VKGAYIDTVEPEDATGLLARLYKAASKRSDKVYHVLQISSLNPDVLRAWIQLYRAVMFGPSPLSRADRELIAVSVSWANGCHY
jgi:alkylhydroperoxidase family enzyme